MLLLGIYQEIALKLYHFHKLYNNLLHKKGVISMARTTEPNSASSQFFIMLDDNSTLDGNYAAFGEVTAGWDTVEKICAA